MVGATSHVEIRQEFHEMRGRGGGGGGGGGGGRWGNDGTMVREEDEGIFWCCLTRCCI